MTSLKPIAIENCKLHKIKRLKYRSYINNKIKSFKVVKSFVVLGRILCVVHYSNLCGRPLYKSSDYETGYGISGRTFETIAEAEQFGKQVMLENSKHDWTPYEKLNTRFKPKQVTA